MLRTWGRGRFWWKIEKDPKSMVCNDDHQFQNRKSAFTPKDRKNRFLSRSWAFFQSEWLLEMWKTYYPYPYLSHFASFIQHNYRFLTNIWRSLLHMIPKEWALCFSSRTNAKPTREAHPTWARSHQMLWPRACPCVWGHKTCYDWEVLLLQLLWPQRWQPGGHSEIQWHCPTQIFARALEVEIGPGGLWLGNSPVLTEVLSTCEQVQLPVFCLFRFFPLLE